MDRDLLTLSEAVDPAQPPRLRPVQTLDDLRVDARSSSAGRPARPRPEVGSLGGRWLRWALGLLPVVAMAVWR